MITVFPNPAAGSGEKHASKRRFLTFFPTAGQDPKVGFDWMRPTYLSLKGTPAFSEIAKAFPPGHIEDTSYFGPWIALTPGQSIKLEMNMLRSPGLSQLFFHFNSRLLKVEQDKTQLKITILGPFSHPEHIFIYNTNREKVGQVNVLPSRPLQVPIRIIALVNKSDREASLWNIQRKIRGIDLSKLLKGSAFQQANIQWVPEHSLTNPDQLHIRSVPFTAEEWDTSPVFHANTSTFTNPLIGFRGILNQCESVEGEYHGITLILTNLSARQQRGDGAVRFPGMTSKHHNASILFKEGFHPDVLIHELGHALGLSHSFAALPDTKPFAFPQGTTRNFMDYRSRYTGPTELDYFSVWQWKRMRTWINHRHHQFSNHLNQAI